MAKLTNLCPSILTNFNYQHLGIQAVLLLLIAFGCAAWCSLFLRILQWIGDFRQAHHGIIYALPLVGFGVAWSYQRYGQKFASGLKLVQQEIKQPKAYIGLAMAPFILLSTWLSHLFGASVGREGTALQMSASWTDWLCRCFKISHQQRPFYLKASLAAGFAAAFGTPWAAVLFTFEFSQQKSKAWPAFLVLSCAYLSYVFSQQMGTPHSHYVVSIWPNHGLKTWLLVLLAGLLFGQMGRVYMLIQQAFQNLFAWVKSPLHRPVLGGVVFLLAIALAGEQFLGLGLAQIQKAFHEPLTSSDFLIKSLLTLLCLSAGFKGGEVTPLFFIGATMGNALSLILPLPMGFLAALGFVSVFAAAAKMPLTCAVMACELFGWQILPFALLACVLAWLSSGKQGIYRWVE